MQGIQTLQVRFHHCKGLHNFVFGDLSRVKSVKITKCGVVEHITWLPLKLERLAIRKTTLLYLKKKTISRLGCLKTLRFYQPQVSFEDFNRLLALKTLRVLEILGPNTLCCRTHLETIFSNTSIQKFTAENFGAICFNFIADLCSLMHGVKHLCFLNSIWFDEDDIAAAAAAGDPPLLSLQEWLEINLGSPFHLSTIPRRDFRDDKGVGIASFATWKREYELDLPAPKKRGH